MAMVQITVLLLVAVSLSPVAGHQDVLGFTIELPQLEEHCFYQPFKEAKQYVLEYSVLAGGQLDVDVILTSPNGKILYKEPRINNDRFEFETSYGTYMFCFGNKFSTVTQKVVWFVLRPKNLDELGVEAGKRIPTAHTQLEDSLENIHESGTRIKDLQIEYRLHEARGRYEAEELRLKVQYVALLMTAAILVSGLGQVCILKTFFNDKRTWSKDQEITPSETQAHIGP